MNDAVHGGVLAVYSGGALRRQWYLVLAGLLITFGMGYGAGTMVGPSYEAKAMVVLLPPSASVPKAGNPYLNLANMQPVVGVLSDALSGKQTGTMLNGVSATARYTALPDPSTSGSVIVLDVKDKTPTGAQNVLDALVREVPRQLDQLQSATDTPKPGLITTDLVTKDTKPTVSTKSQLRAILLALALGFSLTVAGASFLDGRRARRATRGPGASRRHQTRKLSAASAHEDAHIVAPEAASTGRRARRSPKTQQSASDLPDELSGVGLLPTGRRP